MRQHHADIRVVRKCSTPPVIAHSTNPKCTVITGMPAKALMRRWAFTNQPGGATPAQRCYGITHFAAVAKPRVCCSLPKWWITSFQSKKAANVLSDRICRACACPVTTQRPPQKPLPCVDGVNRGEGGFDLYRFGQRDAHVWSIFCACKLNQGGIPPHPHSHPKPQRPCIK